MNAVDPNLLSSTAHRCVSDAAQRGETTSLYRDENDAVWVVTGSVLGVFAPKARRREEYLPLARLDSVSTHALKGERIGVEIVAGSVVREFISPKETPTAGDGLAYALHKALALPVKGG